MKTLKEYQAEVARTAEKDRNDHQRLLDTRRSELAAIAERAIALWSGATEESRETARRIYLSGAPGTNLACDGCGTQLVFTHPELMLLNGMRDIGCAGCGWRGYL
jgi:hypothetical protein